MYSTQVNVLSTTANYIMTVSLEQNTQLQGIAGVAITLRSHKQTLSKMILRCTSNIYIFLFYIFFFFILVHLSSPSTIVLLISVRAPKLLMLPTCVRTIKAPQECTVPRLGSEHSLVFHF